MLLVMGTSSPSQHSICLNISDLLNSVLSFCVPQECDGLSLTRVQSLYIGLDIINKMIELELHAI